MNRPDRLPRSFGRIWELLSAADGETRSRRSLAARMQISTHTLQRILKEGDVPDLAQPQSAYIRGSWVRTITRIACGLGIDAVELVRSTGTVIDPRTAGMIESERVRFRGTERSRGGDAGRQELRSRRVHPLASLTRCECRAGRGCSADKAAGVDRRLSGGLGSDSSRDGGR